jgi:O-succinylbenzoate synthase
MFDFMFPDLRLRIDAIRWDEKYADARRFSKRMAPAQVHRHWEV